MAIRTAFVTGGSGFVGRTLIQELRKNGTNVRALARSDSAAAEVKKHGAEPVRGDLADEKLMRAGMEGCDAVFHVAAHVVPWGKYSDFHLANVVGTQNVLRAARGAGVKRFVHCSTEAVLVGGKKPIVNADETWPVPKVATTYPYSRSKAEAERLVQAANCEAMQTVICRPRLIWGRGDTVVMAQMIAAVERGQFAWLGGGNQLTSTAHVRNVVEGLILAAEKGTGGSVYFLADGKPRVSKLFFTRMLATQGVAAKGPGVPYWLCMMLAFLLEQLWWLASFVCTIKTPPPFTRQVVKLIGQEMTVNDAKARKELGYKALVSEDVGMRELEEDYRAAQAEKKRSSEKKS